MAADQEPVVSEVEPRDEGAYPQRSVSEEQRRAAAIQAPTLRAGRQSRRWRRCSLLAERIGYARRSRLAITCFAAPRAPA